MYVQVKNKALYFTVWQLVTYDENFQLPALRSL